MTSLLINSIYLLPRRRKEHPAIESIRLAECDECLLTGQMLKGDGSIDQASVKKDPPSERLSEEPIGQGHFDKAVRERNCVAPWEG